MSKFRKPSILLNPDPEVSLNKKIATFQIPWLHRDLWNDKDWYYSIEGVWYMTSCENMDKVLSLMGAGPATSSMVCESDMVLSLQEDVDFGWWVRYEYLFKGKNRRGFKARAHKMTSNKFVPESEKPESLEDWDKRLTLTTVSLIMMEEAEEEENVKLLISQISDKEVEFRYDSEIVFEVDGGDLIMTTTVYTKEGPVSGIRRFVQFNLDNLANVTPNSSRRNSYQASPHASRRSSVNLAAQPFLRRLSTDVHDGGQQTLRLANSLIPESPKTIFHRRPSIEVSHH